MFINLKRHLMAEADQGGASGNPAAPTTPASAQPENVTQAQGSPAITKEVSDLIASEIAKGIAAQRDAIFAEARRTFTGKQTKPKEEPAPTAPTTTADPIKLRALDRALSKHGFAERISDAMYRRLEREYVADAPDDAHTWVKDFFDGLGVAPAPAAPQVPAPQPAPAATPAPAQRNAAPVSDRGAPPVPAAPLDQQRILSLSPQDRDALRKQVGEAEYVKRLLEESRNATVRLR